MFIYNTELDDCLTIISPKIYNIYLTDKGNELSKIMLYLKKKFSVPLSEIKQFCLRDKILLGIGNSIIVDDSCIIVSKSLGVELPLTFSYNPLIETSHPEIGRAHV